MPPVLLSAALIVRNEERLLAECLDSLRNVVDEVIVVDTGSDDATPQIAADHGATVARFPWTDDFAAARNRALDLARGKWIFYIDADERLRPGTSGNLRAELSQPARIGYNILLHPKPGFTPYWVLRLFLNDPSIRFQGRIHENIWPALRDYQSAHGGKIGRIGLVLDHQGYTGNQLPKHQRNLPLLERSLREDPSRIYCWCHLADIKRALGDDAGAEHAFRQAIDIVRRNPRPQMEHSLPWVGLIQLECAGDRDASASIEEALRLFPENLQLQWLAGRFRMQSGNYAAGLPHFERLARAGETGDYSRDAAHDERLLNVLAYENLAICHFRLGRYETSRHYYELAALHDPHRLEYRVKASLCASLERAGRE